MDTAHSSAGRGEIWRAERKASFMMWKEEEEWESEKKEKPIMFYCGPKRAIERDAMWSAEIGSRDVIAIGQWHHPVCMCVWCRCNTHRPASLSLSLSLLASVSLLYLQIVATHKIWGFPRCFTWHCAQPEHTARTNGMPAAGRLEKRSRGKKKKEKRERKEEESFDSILGGARKELWERETTRKGK